MRNGWRIIAVVCAATQVVLPAFSFPCARVLACVGPVQTGPNAAASASTPAPARPTQEKRCKSACHKCAKKCGTTAVRKAADAGYRTSASTAVCTAGRSSGCGMCPCRQPKQQETSPSPLPTSPRHEQEQARPVSLAVVQPAPLIPGGLLSSPYVFDSPADSSSHNERQSQIVCWLK